MKIVVLAGGLSPERNVSLSTGTMVCKALRRNGHEAALVDLFFGLEGTDAAPEALFSKPLSEDALRISPTAPDLAAVRAARRDKSGTIFGPGVLELCALADAVFIALHGTCGEDGRVQAAFDLLGIPYTGSGYLGSAIAMDKDLTKRILAGSGVRTPAWRVLDYTAGDIARLSGELSLPCVVKPLDNGSSIGVFIAHDAAELTAALEAGLSFGGHMLAEDYIAGREIQTGVLEERALPSIEIIPNGGFYDYTNKYQPGAAREVCPAQIPAEVERRLGEAACTVHRLLGLAVYSRTDFILTPGGEIWFLEINTLPGMTPTSLVPQEAAAVGIGYDALCERILRASLEIRRK